MENMAAGESAGEPPSNTVSVTPETENHLDKAWIAYISEDLPRTVAESADSAVRSARSLQQNSSSHIRTLQDHVHQYTSQYRSYEDWVFGKIKDQITVASEHPALTAGIGITSALLLMRGPRRFLFRRTLGRFQSEEAQITKASKNIQDLTISVQVMTKESEKLLQRAKLAETEMTTGYGELRTTGGDIKSLAKSVHKAECQANDLVDDLREIAGRDAIQLRAEVAKMASTLKEKRLDMNKRINNISELGVRV